MAICPNFSNGVTSLHTFFVFWSARNLMMPLIRSLSGMAGISLVILIDLHMRHFVPWSSSI
eukprot:16118012-Heterocapsa_arctica.AAC.1